MRRLSLFIPDVFKPLQLKGQDQGEIALSVPFLSKLLSRANRSHFPAAKSLDTLFRLFGITLSPDTSYPIAALTYLAEVGDPNRDWCLRIDPVHLQIDRDHLVLIDDHLLKITKAEAERIITTLNSNYQEDGWDIVPGVASHWYIRMSTNPQIHTHTLSDVTGKTIQPYLMSGQKRQQWQSIMNEVQMLLHDHPVNTQRAGTGQLPVNSVWIWGEGSLCALEPFRNSRSWQRVYTNDTLCAGVALFTGHEAESLPQDVGRWLEANGDTENILIVLDDVSSQLKYGDMEQWRRFMTDFEEKWARPLHNTMKQGLLETLELYDGSGRRYVITPRLLKRWWKRRLPLPQSI